MRGNPVILPEVEQLWRDCTHDLLNSPEYSEVVCRYGASQGYEPLIEAVINDFNQRYGLQLTQRNILITPGKPISLLLLRPILLVALRPTVR